MSLRSERARVRRHVGLPVVSAIGALAVGAALLLPLGSEASPRGLGPLALLTEEQAMAAAQESGLPVVASALTTSTMIVTALPEKGVFRAEISPVPVRVQDPGSGVWSPVDNTLVRDADGTIRPAVAATPMTFSTGGDSPLASIADPEGTLALSWPGPLPEPTLVGTAAVYENVLPDVDLVARAGTLGFSTYLVVHTPQAAQHPMVRQFAFDVESDGVELSEAAGESLVARNDDGKTIFRASQPFAWDSGETAQTPAQESGSALRDEEVAVGAPLSAPADAEQARMTVNTTGDQLQLTPPAALLTDADTNWPLVLDPGFTATKDSGDVPAWTMLWSKNGGNFYGHPTEDARVGYDGWSDGKISRSYFKIDISSLNGDKVHQAVVSHKQIHSPNHNCKADSFGAAVQVGITGDLSSSTTWSTRPGWWDSSRVASNYRANGHEDYCGGYITQEWNLTGSLQEKAEAEDDSIWIGMRSANEGDANGWRRYDNNSTNPKLSVDYSIIPNAPADLQVVDALNRDADGYWTSTRTPTLRAAVHSPNGGGAKVHFEVWKGSTREWQGETSGASNGTPLSLAVPAGELSDGTYTVRAYSWANPDPNYPDSGTLKSTSYASYIINIDTVRPESPTIVLAQKTEDGACRVAAPCRLLFRYDTADNEKIYNFKYGLNTDDTDFETSRAGTDRKDYQPVIPQSFGPGWVSARSVDLAGNPSLDPSTLDRFWVDGAVMSHQWSFNDPNYTADTAPAILEDGVRMNPSTPMNSLPTTPSGHGPIGLNDYDNGVVDAKDATLVLTGTGTSQTTSTSGAVTPVKAGEDFTISAWVWLDAAQNGLAVSQGTAGGHTWYLGYFDNKWKFKGYTGTSGSTGTSISAEIPDTTPHGHWVHLIGSYNAQTGKGTDQHSVTLYVTEDRTTKSATASTATATGSTRRSGFANVGGPLWIGRGTNDSSAAAWFWKGAIDEIRTFPGILDASQIRRMLAERRVTY